MSYNVRYINRALSYPYYAKARFAKVLAMWAQRSECYLNDITSIKCLYYGYMEDAVGPILVADAVQDWDWYNNENN